jgi:hypothetical protein
MAGHELNPNRGVNLSPGRTQGQSFRARDGVNRDGPITTTAAAAVGQSWLLEGA